MEKSIILDQNGNVSSKRIAMLVALSYSMVMGTLGALGITDPTFTIALVKGFLTFSGGIGGISVAEFFKKE